MVHAQPSPPSPLTPPSSLLFTQSPFPPPLHALHAFLVTPAHITPTSHHRPFLFLRPPTNPPSTYSLSPNPHPFTRPSYCRAPPAGAHEFEAFAALISALRTEARSPTRHASAALYASLRVRSSTGRSVLPPCSPASSSPLQLSASSSVCPANRLPRQLLSPSCLPRQLALLLAAARRRRGLVGSLGGEAVDCDESHVQRPTAVAAEA